VLTRLKKCDDLGQAYWQGPKAAGTGRVLGLSEAYSGQTGHRNCNGPKDKWNL
jgi:hypothetical protein